MESSNRDRLDARELRRKLMNDVFPQFLEPTTKILNHHLVKVSCAKVVCLLEWRRILSLANPSWAVEPTYCAASVAITTSMRHALSASIWIDISLARSSGNGRDGNLGWRTGGVHIGSDSWIGLMV